MNRKQRIGIIGWLGILGSIAALLGTGYVVLREYGFGPGPGTVKFTDHSVRD